ncbi:MAG TPA: cardiolipin synthase [Saprospiraceae bacterium]|jgi:cardiolipin synthase|nr:cardiolipin synthase [Saprospiraceae bacterium]HNC32833.1 cardiolipin synthase [Bacteroidia bacterium]MBX7178990.1 cardiolipin synthase [Saprospiraceae bacterium]MCB0591452.1 cardiolipin synthase [Saprospiraceae bacterium]MCO5282247.1 cardiolipin synthase [Saprospiraceae bacterium]
MSWLIFFEILYIAFLVMVCLRIIYDTRTTTKTLAYLLLVFFVPVGGMVFYFLFGVNYRNRKMYSKKLFANEEISDQVSELIYHYSKQTFEENDAAVKDHKSLAYMLVKDTQSPLTANNEVKLLLNGENKFPEVIKALKEAKHHIHLEYYIYEDDEIGRQIEKILIDKARQGVAVRFIYDDFGSHSIGKNLAKRLIKNGVNVFPFLKINFIFLANRINYRNHRKIIIIDGQTAFVGGINVSDRYINHHNSNQQFWRDTHLRIDGRGVHYLQYLFLCDWNFCSNEKLQPDELFFPRESTFAKSGDKVVQIVASGPDSETPTILFSVLKAINLASKEILITSPYFIPGESLTDALVIASLSGISVKLLVPGVSDSFLVNTAANSYYSDLLNAGVEIYLYNKGFIHAKTMITDEKIAIVGTANMDYRSFDLNFEVNAIVYDEEVARQLRNAFYEDISHSEKIDAAKWKSRSKFRQLLEKTARLLSPML